MNIAQYEGEKEIPAIGGQILFHQNETNAAYRIRSGEVVIVRNGQMIDLVEKGELLDPQMWHGATAIAWTDCILEILEAVAQLPTNMPVMQVPTFVPAMTHDKQLALAA